MTCRKRNFPQLGLEHKQGTFGPGPRGQCPARVQEYSPIKGGSRKCRIYIESYRHWKAKVKVGKLKQDKGHIARRSLESLGSSWKLA